MIMSKRGGQRQCCLLYGPRFGSGPGPYKQNCIIKKNQSLHKYWLHFCFVGSPPIKICKINYFWSFRTNKIFTKLMWKISICLIQDSNTLSRDHESPTLTTRPGLDRPSLHSILWAETTEYSRTDPNFWCVCWQSTNGCVIFL